ncbi:MAG: gamma-glutamyltransferase [Chthonomonadales bacterium]|nr:gamma-glutamyltransferase [Chthonomonadales bacterium]
MPSDDTWNGQIHRGIVVAQRGMVAASQPLAVSAGIGILRDGGSFADAAIATSAVLAVVEPYNSHLGGDVFAIVWDQGARRALAFNGSGRSPQQLEPRRYADGIPIRGIRAATVPGMVDAWCAIHQRFGRLPLSRLLEPAIEYAENGFPAGFRYAQVFTAHAESGQDWTGPVLRELTGLTGPPRPGQTIRQPNLAQTLAAVASSGRQGFYEGRVAQAIVDHSRAMGGFFELSDLADHRTVVTQPLTTTYRGMTIHAQPPVSQGVILVEMLNILEGYDLAAWGFGTPRCVHAMVEAKKLAFADRIAMLGDPERVADMSSVLASKDFAARRRSRLDMSHAGSADPEPEPGRDTTYFCIADREGNAISFIQSVYHAFGCGVVVPGTGVLLNNRLTGFSLDPQSPNALAPAKRPIHTLNAYVVTDGPQLRYVGGTPGGDVQVQSNLQVITSLVDFQMNVQQAVEAPRWQHVPDGDRMAIHAESRFGPELLRALEGLGHHVRRLGPWQHSSSYQLIEVDPNTGSYFGASDPRCDGHAAGL